MSLVQNLPVDNNPVTKQETELVQMLFQEAQNTPPPSTHHVGTASDDQRLRLLHIFQEGLLIILLFLFFTLSFVDKLCLKYLSFMNETTIYIARIVIILILFWVIKTYLL